MPGAKEDGSETKPGQATESEPRLPAASVTCGMTGIDNIIFDLGGVVLNIDVSRTHKAFTELGVRDIEKYFGHGFAASFFSEHEKGLISDEVFLDRIREMTGLHVPDARLTDAWNALLLDFPPERIELLKAVAKKYRIFLFSNTNAIHHARFQEIYENAFGPALDSHFEKAWYSHELNMRKPDTEAFDAVVADAGLDRARTLFVDDALVNIQGAIAAGLKGLYLPPGMAITDIRW